MLRTASFSEFCMRVKAVLKTEGPVICSLCCSSTYMDKSHGSPGREGEVGFIEGLGLS